MRDAKHGLQRKIDSGAFTTFAELMQHVLSQGWTVARHGASYISVEIEGRRVRFHFPFVNDLFVLGKTIRVEERAKARDERKAVRRAARLADGYWIYALLAHSDDGKACYVGQTTNYIKRFGSHLARNKHGRGSTGLFEWAEVRGASVMAVLLDFVPKGSDGIHQASLATTTEGLWLQRAIAAGYVAPLIEYWGRLPQAGGIDNVQWPAMEIQAVCLPVLEVKTNELPPEAFGTKTALLKFRG